MNINNTATGATDEVLCFDHVMGQVYTGQPRVMVDPPASPLRRLQGRLQASNRPRIYRLGNCVSDVRFWLDRLIR